MASQFFLQFFGALFDNNNPVALTELIPTNVQSMIQALLQDRVIYIETEWPVDSNYLHLIRPDHIIHRDISSANVLLESIGSGCWRAKVSVLTFFSPT